MKTDVMQFSDDDTTLFAYRTKAVSNLIQFLKENIEPDNVKLINIIVTACTMKIAEMNPSCDSRITEEMVHDYFDKVRGFITILDGIEKLHNESDGDTGSD